jgi:hypothetical protein
MGYFAWIFSVGPADASSKRPKELISSTNTSYAPPLAQGDKGIRPFIFGETAL